MSIPKAESYDSFASRENKNNQDKIEEFTKYLIEYREELAQYLGISTEELHEKGNLAKELNTATNK